MLPEETNYYYLETVPKHRTMMEFEFPECAGKLRFDQRYSMGEVTDGRIRNVFLRGRLDKKCSSQKKSFMTYEVNATDTLMTHVFIVMDKEVRAIKLEAQK